MTTPPPDSGPPADPPRTPDDGLDRALRAAFGRPRHTHYDTDNDTDNPSTGASMELSGTVASLRPVLPPLTVNEAPTRVMVREGGDDEEPGQRYDLLNEVARGGAGSVMRARDHRMGRVVAMKILGRRHGRRTTMAMRFLDEVRIAGQLQHPGVVPVYDRGEIEDGQLYFTMKLVRGETLSAMLKARPDPATDRHRFLRIFEQICQTIAYAHSRGVVHRDLKPANIMVGRFGEVVVLDWGLARVLRNPATSVDEPVDSLRADDETAEGGTYGTPAFMPPEQARGKSMDERADVFSLGAVLCQILTGKPPYAGTSSLALLGQAAQGRLEGVHDTIAASGADQELVQLAVQCLQPEPERRPRHAGVLAEQVAGYLAQVDQRARDAEVEAVRQRARAVSERRVRRLAVGLAAAALLIIGIVAWVAWTRAERQREADQRVEELLIGASAHRGHTEWAEAVELCRRAVDVAQTGHASQMAAERAATLLDECVAAQQREGLLAAIGRVRDQVALNPPDAGTLYEAAFREFGIDVQSPPDQAATSIRSHPTGTAAALVRALDDWASRIPPHGTPQEIAVWRRIVMIAAAADTDTWRNLLRQALLAGETMVLEELARTVSDEPRPPQNFLLLAQGMDRLFMSTDTEINVLLAGYWQHPDDYWINISLAHRLAFSQRGRPDMRSMDWAERHARAAWSLEPESSEAVLTLAITLMIRSRYARPPRPDDSRAARELFERARQITPSDREVTLDCIRAALLSLDGKRDEARTIAEQIASRRQRFSPPITGLLNLLQGR